MTKTTDEDVRVRATTSHPATDVIQLRLTPVDQNPVAPWSPGAHIDLRTPGGAIRQYSLCGKRADQEAYTVAVRREAAGCGGSQELFDIAPGAELTVMAVRNKFTFESATTYLFVAGGIGITPILSMIEAAEENQASWQLLYIGRGRQTMPFLDDLSDYGSQVRVVDTTTEARPDVHVLLNSLSEGTRVYACGPQSILDALAAAPAALDGRVTVSVEPFSTSVETDTSGAEFEVVAQRSDLTVTVGADETILGALQRKGLSLPYSCEEGYCGTCETGILAGRADHRDTYLDEDERESNDTVMICVSRSATPQITLDI